MNEKKYCGKAKVFATQHGEIFKISLSPSDIEMINQNTNAKGWCNIDMCEMRNADKNGNTFYLAINDYQARNRQNNQKSQQYPQAQYNEQDIEEDDIPF